MIPDFNQSGVLPPFLATRGPTDSAAMAPYPTSMAEVADTLGFSVERRGILSGLLDFRRALQAAGFTDGFQWLAGSYLEDCETQRRRPPKDVDVVTFARRPPALQEQGAWNKFVAGSPELFDRNVVKSAHSCDAFFVDLSLPPEAIVSRTRYWFGLFSHQRATYLWKGILQIPLHANDDAALALLSGDRKHAS
ncbi:DUF6932 family protein [Alkalispirillum mobile]|uniref:DUF6932 family protein n=1 Tax=Alkalispirillum mobile TaxID=85925 RepID=UPI0011C3C4A1|nr:hypothetical protein [Alkalispirillum mobile]